MWFHGIRERCTFRIKWTAMSHASEIPTENRRVLIELVTGSLMVILGTAVSLKRLG